jgi:hypothetical protein
MDKRVTNKNKNSIINEINKHAKEYSLPRLSKNASVKDVQKAKKDYQTELSSAIVNIAIRQGNTTLSSIYGKDLIKSEDKELKRLGRFAEQLAEAKRQSDKHLDPSQKAFLERGNLNVLGYGNENLIDEFDKTKNDKQVLELIEKVKKQDPRKIYYDKQIGTFENIFQKIELYREEDLDKLKEKLREMNFLDLKKNTDSLLQSLEIYGSDQVRVGQGDDETELANARLDDTLIRLGLVKGKEKQQKIADSKSILNKYEERTRKAREEEKSKK